MSPPATPAAGHACPRRLVTSGGLAPQRSSCALLVQVAGRLQSAVRPGDLVVRLGGDEFVVPLGLVGRQDAEPVMTRLLGAAAVRPAPGG